MARRRRRSLRRCCLPSRRWEIVYAASLPNARAQPVAQLALARINATAGTNSRSDCYAVAPARLALPSVASLHPSKEPIEQSKARSRIAASPRSASAASRREPGALTQALRDITEERAHPAARTQQRHATHATQGRTAPRCSEPRRQPHQGLPQNSSKHGQGRRPDARSCGRVRCGW